MLSPATHRPLSHFGFSEGLMSATNLVAQNLYNRGEGVRYAVEQTLGYTVPRTLQQLWRSKEITGENNPQAAREAFFQELGSDFSDTFLPGILATWLISKGLVDPISKTLTRFNIESDALNFYQQVLNETSDKKAFYKQLEQELIHAQDRSLSEGLALQLEQRVHRLSQWEKAKGPLYPIKATQTLLDNVINNQPSVNPYKQQATELADLLNKSRFGTKLEKNGVTWTVKIENMLKDLVGIEAHQANLMRLSGQAQWGKTLAKQLQRTDTLQPVQFLGTGLALVTSLSIPFLIRLDTRRKYGRDEFPGTHDIRGFFYSKDELAEQSQEDEQKFRLFPYLEDSLKEHNWLPMGITAVFASALAVLPTFTDWAGEPLLKKVEGKLLPQPNFKGLKGLSHIFRFERHFPFTSLKQMEVTYGLMCLSRLVSSRDDSEFREKAIRDALLGWPTLTYFFPMAQNKLGSFFEGQLQKKLSGIKELSGETLKKLQTQSIIMREKGGERFLMEAEELSPTIIRNALNISSKEAKAVSKLALAHHGQATVVSGFISFLLLALLEPAIGIRVTNAMEMGKIKQQKQKAESILPVSVGSLAPVADTSMEPKALFTYKEAKPATSIVNPSSPSSLRLIQSGPSALKSSTPVVNQLTQNQVIQPLPLVQPVVPVMNQAIA